MPPTIWHTINKIKQEITETFISLKIKQRMKCTVPTSDTVNGFETLVSGEGFSVITTINKLGN